MTTSDVDKLMRVLTEFRVESAGKLATLQEQIKALGGMPVAIEKLSGRVTALELQGASAGKFTWGDVFRVAAALAALTVVGGAVVSVVLLVGRA